MASNLKYDMTIMILFSFVGIIIKLFFGNKISEDGSEGPANAALWGYGIVAMSILVIMFVNFALASQMLQLTNYETNTIGFIKALFSNSAPILLTLVVLIWIIALNMTYFKKINEGRVANEYNTFSTISTVLIVVQLIVLFKYLNDELLSKGGNKMAGIMKGQMASITYVLSILNIAFAGMMNITLEFFSTDG